MLCLWGFEGVWEEKRRGKEGEKNDKIRERRERKE
jgi:hypothetical protein